MLASPAHLYIPHLFTHCLPTIICVMLMSIAFFSILIYATFLCDSILDCLCTYFCLFYCYLQCLSFLVYWYITTGTVTYSFACLVHSWLHYFRVDCATEEFYRLANNSDKNVSVTLWFYLPPTSLQNILLRKCL